MRRAVGQMSWSRKMWTNRQQLRVLCLPSLLAALALSLCLGNTRAQTLLPNGRYVLPVGQAGEVCCSLSVLYFGFLVYGDRVF